MMKRIHLVVVVLILSMVALWLAGEHYTKRETMRVPVTPDAIPSATRSSTLEAGETTSDPDKTASPEPVEDSAAVNNVADAREAEPSSGSVPQFIRRVIAEKWLDPEDKVTARRRIRIVEADFKYPFLRMEESVSRDPVTGEVQVSLIRSSVADHVLIGLKPEVDGALARNALAEQGFEIRAEESGSYVLAEISAHEDPDAQEQAIARLGALDEFIDFAEPDYLVHPTVVPNDPEFGEGKLWALDNPGTTSGTRSDADIDAPEAWNVLNDASTVIVAVTDTGIHHQHEDLAANMWTDAQGRHGFDAYDDDDDPMDTTGHGTHCAGIIGARGNNAKGISGVAWNVRLMAGRFLGPNGGTTSDAIRVINYARLNGADVINASWGGGGKSQGLEAAIWACYLEDILFVAAAGNDGSNTDASPHYPSSYVVPNIVSVAATGKDDRLSAFSNYGVVSVDLAAPGSNILSCGVASPSDYQYLSGTSMAAPHVAGALALAKARFPSDRGEELVTRLIGTVDTIFELAGATASSGRLNLHSLLTRSEPVVFHDFFDNPYPFKGCFAHWCGDSGRGTREPDEDLFSPDSGTKSLWFSWVAPENGLVSFKGSGNKGDVSVVAFEGTERNALKRIADNFKQRPVKVSYLNFYARKGVEYRFSLDSRRLDDQLLVGSLTFRAGNDMLADAFTLPTSGNFSITGSNCGATWEPFESARPHAGRSQGKSVWWRLVPDFSGNLTLTTQGSEFDTVLAVYTGSPGAGLVEVAANDDRSSLDSTSQVGFAAVAGTTYHVVVDSFRPDMSGGIQLNGFKDDYFAILNQPVDTVARVGDRAVFSVSTLSAGTPSYQWFHNGQPVFGETRRILVLDNVKSAQFGNYHVEVRNEIETLISESALLSEVQVAPVITWKSGNLSVASGGSAGFSVVAGGSGPFTYRWYKNGVLIPAQSGSTLFLNPVAAGDAGSYEVVVGNQRGNASARMLLTVVPSPWDGFEWRRPGVENHAITDLQSSATEAHAVAGDSLLRSTDGVNWTKSKFPSGFLGRTFAVLGSRRICLGYLLDGSARVAVSVSGGAWTLQPVAGLPTSLQGEYRLSVFKTVFLARSPQSVASGSFYSTDGVNWTACQAVNESNAAVLFSAQGVPASDGQTMIIASADSPVSGQLQFYRTTNGINWVLAKTQATGASATGAAQHAVHMNGQFHLVGSGQILSSANTQEWTAVSFGSAISVNRIAAGGGGIAVFLSDSTQAIQWFTTPSQPLQRSVFPSSSQNFTAAAVFQGKILYGTEKGHLGAATDGYGVSIPEQRSSTLTSLAYRAGYFVAASTGADTSLLISGDGVTWKTTNSGSASAGSYRGFAAGRYWGDGAAPGGGVVNNQNNPIRSGVTPFNWFLPPSPGDSLPAPLYWIGESPSGDLLAVAAASSTDATRRVYARASGASTWSVAPATTHTHSAPRFLAGKWYSIGSNSELYASVDGLSWQAVGLGNQVMGVTEKNGTLYVMRNWSSTPEVCRSTNGTTWTFTPATGLRTLDKFTELLIFNDSLVALTVSKRLYFSSDGATWVQASLPAQVVGIAVGQGQFVAALSTGGILQTGPAHAGGHAPLVGITSPPHLSSHVLGSEVEIAGRVSDPPQASASFVCYLDGAPVHSGSGSEFSFSFTATNRAGHVVEVVATDAHGLVNADSVRINVVESELENLLAEVDGVRSINPGFVAELNGTFYVLGGKSLFRSSDGREWTRIEIPVSTGQVSSMASGNGALVIQFSDGNIVTSRDGIQWLGFLPNQASSSWAGGLRFESGRFIAVSGGNRLRISEDGITWKEGLSNQLSSILWWAAEPNGRILAASAGRFYRSDDRGNSWVEVSVPVPGIGGGYNTSGIHADGKFIVYSFDSNTFHQSSDGITWTSSNTPAVPSAPGGLVSRIGSRYFIGNAGGFVAGSRDGVVWSMLPQAMPTKALVFTHGFYIGATPSGIMWSADGEDWKLLSGGSAPSDIVSLASNGDLILAVAADGGTWISEDGVRWKRGLTGRGSGGVSSTQLVTNIERLGNRWMISGNGGLLAYSDDEGSSWRYASVNGVTAPSMSNSDRYVRLKAGEGVAFASTTNSIGRMIRTTDGVAWSHVTLPSGLIVADFATDGSNWLVVATTGEIFRSSDVGLTWSPVPSGLAVAKAVGWVGTNWVIVGSTASDAFGPLSIYTLGQNDQLTLRRAAGFNNGSTAVQALGGHGKLLVWSGVSPLLTSSNGTDWTASNFASSQPSAYQVIKTSQGFTATAGTSSATFAWQSGPDGSSWTSVAPVYGSRMPQDTVGDRVFGFSSGWVQELITNDLSLRFVTPPVRTLGVGDRLELDVMIANRGASPVAVGNWKVEAYLSKDRYFGDSNDVLLGSRPLAADLPAPGATLTTEIDVEVPERVLTGTSYVVLRLVGPKSFSEVNTVNNIAMSREAFVSIPEWELGLVSNGNGRINQDFAAPRYPHKARVSLTASAGKGVAFTGWGGDAIGAESQITVLMDGNKDVLANFSSRVTLQLFVKGLGGVAGLADRGSYPLDGIASLTATPAPGWVFAGWSGASEGGNATTSVVMDAPKVLTARFTLPLSTWKGSHFSAAEMLNSAVSGDEADPDGDGLKNWQEYLHASLPKDAGSRGFSSSLDSGYLSIFYTRHTGVADGFVLNCEASRDLVDWEAAGLQERILDVEEEVETVEARIPTAGWGSGYLRMNYQRTSAPPP